MRLSKLSRTLDEWIAQELITREQAERIIVHEQANDRAQTAKWGAWALGLLGAVAAAVGVISVVAANWATIPDWLKLGVGVMLLSGVLVLASRVRPGLEWVQSTLLVAYAGLVLGMIGLVAQVYHLHGATWRPFALAAALVLPAAVVARHGLVAHVAFVYTFFALITWLDEEVGWRGSFWRDFRQAALFAGIGPVFIAAGTMLQTLQPPLARAMRAWGTAFVVIVSCAAAAAWSGRAHPPELGAAAAFVLLGASELWRTHGSETRVRWASLIAVIALGGLVAGLALLPATSYPLHVGKPFLHAPKLIGFVLFCLGWTAVVIREATRGNRFGMNLAALMVGGRVIILYVELIDDLLTTGLGLLGLGAVFGTAAYLWWRLTRSIERPLAAAGGAA